MLDLPNMSSYFNSAQGKFMSAQTSHWMSALKSSKRLTSLLLFIWWQKQGWDVTGRLLKLQIHTQSVERATLLICYPNLELEESGHRVWKQKQRRTQAKVGLNYDSLLTGMHLSFNINKEYNLYNSKLKGHSFLCHLFSVMRSSPGKEFPIACIWMVTLKDFNHRLKNRTTLNRITNTAQ